LLILSIAVQRSPTRLCMPATGWQHFIHSQRRTRVRCPIYLLILQSPAPARGLLSFGISW
jgi:hypothetical protein